MTLSLIPIASPGATVKSTQTDAQRGDALLASALCVELTIVCGAADSVHCEARSYELVFPSMADGLTAYELAHARVRELIKMPRVNAVYLAPLKDGLSIGMTAQLIAMHNAVLFARAQGA